MRLLFAISVVSFCTVLWLALSLARRIRRDRLVRASSGPQPPATEFFEAGKYRTPRALRLNQDIAQAGTRRNFEDLPVRPSEERAPASAPTPFRDRRPGQFVTPPNESPVREAVVVGSTLQFVMPEAVRPAEALPHSTPPRDISGERKSPQSARSGTFRRVDLSHYNDDMGDLTDPYTHSPRPSGIRPSAAKNA